MKTTQQFTRHILTASLIIALSGCAGMSKQNRNTAIGAAVGAVGGAAVGGVIGHEIK